VYPARSPLPIEETVAQDDRPALVLGGPSEPEEDETAVVRQCDGRRIEKVARVAPTRRSERVSLAIEPLQQQLVNRAAPHRLILLPGDDELAREGSGDPRDATPPVGRACGARHRERQSAWPAVGGESLRKDLVFTGPDHDEIASAVRRHHGAASGVFRRSDREGQADRTARAVVATPLGPLDRGEPAPIRGHARNLRERPMAERDRQGAGPPQPVEPQDVVGPAEDPSAPRIGGKPSNALRLIESAGSELERRPSRCGLSQEGRCAREQGEDEKEEYGRSVETHENLPARADGLRSAKPAGVV